MGAYRLAAQLAHDRQIWLQRLVTIPPAYSESPCCRAPMLPLLTRDLRDAGLICQHCNETLVPFDEIPNPPQRELEDWAAQYAPVHAVAHWDDRQRKTAGDYDHAYENAAEEAERMLAQRRPPTCPPAAGVLPGGCLGRSGRVPGSAAGGRSALTTALGGGGSSGSGSRFPSGPFQV